MIRDFQTKAFNSRFAATINEFKYIDYEQIAKAYKLKYCKVESLKEMDKVRSFIRCKEPCFIELCFTEESDTNPQLGVDMFNQIPCLTEQDIKIIEEEILKCEDIIF